MLDIAVFTDSITQLKYLKNHVETFAMLHKVQEVDEIREEYYAILVDRHLSDVTAEEVVKSIYACKRLKDMPVVVLTSLESVSWNRDIVKYPDFILPKPFNTNVLKNIIHNRIDRIKQKNNSKILIIDDSMTNRKLIAKSIEEHNFMMYQASSAEEAYSILKEDSDFNLITLDMHMPGENGIDFAKKLREMNFFIPIIMVTSEMDGAIKERAFKAGINFFITKPFDTEKLKKNVENIIFSHAEDDKDPILVVNDSSIITALIRKHLQVIGYDSIGVASGEEALKLLKLNRFSLTLIDINLPGMSGIDLLKEIKVMDIPDYLKISLVHTALPDPFLIERAFSAGATDFIQVPFSFQELNIRVLNLIKLKSTIQNLIKSNVELQKAQNSIIELEKKNTALAMGVTANHEINQPLTVLSLSVGMLDYLIEDKHKPEKWKGMISKMRRSIDIIQDILKKFTEWEKNGI